MPGGRAWMVALGAWATLLASSPALAQQVATPAAQAPGDETAPTERPGASAAADQAARELFVVGDRLYAEGDYVGAVAKFEQAYQLSPRPLLLFNIANACERQGDYKAAAAALRRYREVAPPAERAALDLRLARLDERAVNLEREAEARKQADEELSRLRAHTCPVCDSAVGNEPGKLARNSLLIAGGASLAAAIALGAIARTAGSDAERECSGGYCSSAAGTALNRERDFALAADVSLALGIAAVGAGLLLWWREDDEAGAANHSARLQPGLGPGYLGAQLAVSF